MIKMHEISVEILNFAHMVKFIWYFSFTNSIAVFTNSDGQLVMIRK